MQLVEHPSGLQVAYQSMDERSVSAALRQLRPDLVLQVRPRDEGKGGCLVYKVVHAPSGMVVFTWMDAHGKPLPLSHALIEGLKERLQGARNQTPGEEEHNRRRQEESEKQVAAMTGEIVADHQPVLAGRTQVSMATMKKPPYWRRRGVKPKSGVKR